MEKKPIVPVKVKLKAPHTHDGRDYPANAVITMDSDSAEWLIGLGKARAATAKDVSGEPDPA